MKYAYRAYVGIISILLSGCCMNTPDSEIIGIAEFRVIQSNITVGPDGRTTTIDGEEILVESDPEEVNLPFSIEWTSELSVLPSGDCDINLLNSVVTESLKCNRQFTFNSRVIEAGQELKGETFAPLLLQDFSSLQMIISQQDLENRTFFSQGDHEFYLEIGTNDGMTFRDTLSVNIQLL